MNTAPATNPAIYITVIMVLALAVVYLIFVRLALLQRVAELESQLGNRQVDTVAPLSSSINNKSAMPPAGIISSEALEQVKNLMRTKRKLEAIKVFRKATGYDLKASKEAVEALEKQL